MAIRDRLQEIATDLGSRMALAKAAGVSKGRVTQWLDGDVKGLMAEIALNIETNTGYSVRWLVYGKGQKRAGGDAEIIHTSGAAAIPAREWSKFLVIVKAFIDTDEEGRAELASAAISVSDAARKQQGRANRRRD